VKASLKAIGKDLAQSYTPYLQDIPTDPCSLTMSAFTGWLYIEAAGFDKLAKDPPDPRYRSVVQPSVRVPITVVGTGAGVPLAKFLNLIAEATARAQAYLAALLTSAERAQGAAAAGNSTWRNRQNQAIRKYASEAVKALIASRSALRKVGPALAASGYVRVELSSADAAAFQTEIRTRGLPRDIQSMLTVLGLTGAQRAALRSGIAGATPDALTSTSFPSLLTSPGFVRPLNDAITTLRRVAASRG
jgi:hypothetical protein